MTANINPDSLYEDVPEPVSYLPNDVAPDVANLLLSVLQNGVITGANVAAGQVYDRKGHLESDQLGAPRNLSYASSDDDYYVSLTVRIPNYYLVHTEAASALEDLSTKLAEHRLEEAQEELQGLDQNLTDAQKRRDAKPEEIDRLLGQMGKNR